MNLDIAYSFILWQTKAKLPDTQGRDILSYIILERDGSVKGVLKG